MLDLSPLCHVMSPTWTIYYLTPSLILPPFYFSCVFKTVKEANYLSHLAEHQVDSNAVSLSNKME